MLRIQTLAKAASSRKRAWTVIGIWLAVIVVLSALAPSSKPYAVQTGEGSAYRASLSEEANRILAEQFPSDNGLPALFVFHRSAGLNSDDLQSIHEWSQWVSSKERPEGVQSALPYHMLPPAAQDAFRSKDGTTLLFHVGMRQGMDTKELGSVLDQLTERANKLSRSEGLELHVTGPAGIAADTSRLFRNADFVLMTATVVLILVLLIVIYRSPLLAVLPILIAGVVYQGVDRTLGLLGANGWITIDRSASSIMLVLLFAVLTDYCLFIFSRYREELRSHESPYAAMQKSVTGVAEAIIFSGGTVLAAMLALFGTLFKPYHAFAGVFTVALIWMLVAGVTLIPAVFAVAGRASFWPLTARVRYDAKQRNDGGQRSGLWARMSRATASRPRTIAVILLIVLAATGANSLSMKYSYNLLRSFPADMDARVGFERLAAAFPQGQLAPVTVLLQANDKAEAPDKAAAQREKLLRLEQTIQNQAGVYSFSWNRERGANPKDAGFVRSKDGSAISGQLVLDGDPYGNDSLQRLSAWRKASGDWLNEAGLDPNGYSMHFAGQTAVQADVMSMNSRDTVYLFGIMTVTLLVMLAVLTRSFAASFAMVGTMLLSYAATLGAGWLIFTEVLGLDAISYRLPVYTLLFMVALGIDYSIMLVTRIREEARTHSWKEAVQTGVMTTGGVISSAGVILAATFGVLSTQPLQELMLFGAIMVFGILLDTFLIRGVLLPALFIGFDGWFNRPKPNKRRANINID